MKRGLKLITTLMAILILVNFISSLYTYSFAEEDGFDWKGSIKKFETATGNDDANQAAINIVGAIAVIVRIVGMGVAVIMIIVLAIKYMSAAPGDKADIKKHAIVYVVGAIVLFAATQILEIIAQFSTNLKVE